MINENNIEEYLIRKIENDLSIDELEKLDSFLNLHPHYHEDLEAYEKTILVADEKIVFRNPETLKKNVSRTLPIWFNSIAVLSIAASMAAVFIISMYLFYKGSDTEIIANTNDTTKTNSVVISDSSKNSTTESVANTTSIIKVETTTSSKENESIHSKRKNKLNSNSIKNELVINENKKLSEKNIPSLVTFKYDDALQPIYKIEITRIEYKTSKSLIKKSMNPGLIYAAIYTKPDVKRPSVNDVIVDVLEISGKKTWANTYEKYNDIKNKSYALSFNSSLVSFYKSFKN